MPHYPNAPITEAIIDLRVKPKEGITPEILDGVRGDVEESTYPKREALIGVKGAFEIRAGAASASAEQMLRGFKFTSQDGKYIWQSRFEGFTFSRLEPYQDWEQFRSEARRLWSRYRDITGPVAITRIAVRYINRIDIPSESIDLKDYFRTSPEVSPLLPQTLHGFFLQLMVPVADVQAATIINQTLAPPSRDGVTSVVLDIDLFRTECLSDDEQELWDLFETLRIKKNEIFEACLTEKTTGLFKALEAPR